VAADYGAFSLAGQTADLRKGPLLVAATGSYTLNGQTATVLYTQSQIGRNKVDPFPSPVNQQGPVDANIVRANDNLVGSAITAHDGNSLIHVQSGLLMLRPAVLPDGGMYVATDTNEIYFYVNNAWQLLSGWGNSAYHGAFHDSTDQTAAAINTGQVVTFDTTDISNGVTLVSGSQIKMTYAGTYNIQFSVQLANADSQDQDVWLWLKKNGTNVADSGGRVTVVSKHGTVDGHLIAIWNVFLTLAANDYVQLYWETTNTNCRIEQIPAAGDHPAAPSVILTVNRV